MARGLRFVYPSIRCEFDRLHDLEVAELWERAVRETGEERLQDPYIIEWLHERNGIWVHADDNAKREHAKLLLARNVRTMWVYRPGGMLNTRQLMRIVGYKLPVLLAKFAEPKHRQRHYAARTDGQYPDDRIKLVPYTPGTP